MKTPWWFLKKTPLAIMLMPVSWIYYWLSRIVYNCRELRVYNSRRPIICVGNILAGGVGKTPIVRAIASFLEAPIVMRGYKSNAKTSGVGDEALMLSRYGLQVHTGSRLCNVMLLNRQNNARSPIVMDDGLQNPRIHKNISILVFDDSIGYGNGLLLPAGPLREPRSAAAEADAIIVIRSQNPRSDFQLPDNVPVFYARRQTVSPYGSSRRVFAFAGIGYPKKFFNALGRNVVGTKSFADHYQYTEDDLEKLRAQAQSKGAKLLTTEKDWVRLPEYAREEIKYAKLVVNIEDRFFVWLREKLYGRVKK